MCDDQRIRPAYAVLLALLELVAAAQYLSAADLPQPQPSSQVQQQPGPAAAMPADERPKQVQSDLPPDKPATATPERPAIVVLDNREASGILGREVRSAADENMGRIVDVIVDQMGRARAAIIDFGGFLGVGSRKIAVDWNALHFLPSQERSRVILEFTRDQVKGAPEYQEGKPMVVLGAAAIEDMRVTTSATMER